MITNNFKNFCATILEASNSYIGLLPVHDIDGQTWYARASIGTGNFPNFTSYTARTNKWFAGISIGSGARSESVNDYELQTPIFDNFGLTATPEYGLDNGNPYVEYTISIENTGSSSITVSEIGYIQYTNVTQSQGVVDSNSRVTPVLFDRTLLNTPVTIAAGGTGTITYRLKTTI